MGELTRSWELSVRLRALAVCGGACWLVARDASLLLRGESLGAGAAVAAIALSLALSLTRDVAGRRAQALAEATLFGAAALLVTTLLSPRAMALPGSARPLIQPGPAAVTLCLAAGLIAIARRLLQSDRRGLLRRALAAVTSLGLASLLAVALTTHTRAPSPARYLESLELFARLPSKLDTHRRGDGPAGTSESIPLGSFTLLRSCGGDVSAWCTLGVEPRGVEGGPDLGADWSPLRFRIDRSLSVRLDAARGLMVIDDGRSTLIADPNTGRLVPDRLGGLRPRLAPPRRWTALAALALGLALLTRLLLRAQTRGAPIEAELREDRAVYALGRSMHVPVPQWIPIGPVVLWADALRDPTHYRDATALDDARVEPGTLADHHARVTERLAARALLIAAIALFGAAPLGLWATLTLPSAPRLAARGEGRATPPRLSIEVLRGGSGATARAGTRVSVHYTGRLVDGTVFDTTETRGPFEVDLGTNRMIPGFERGLVGMHVGERRRVTIPPSLGYGSRRVGPIPANATLIFEIELLSVEPSGAAR